MTLVAYCRLGSRVARICFCASVRGHSLLYGFSDKLMTFQRLTPDIPDTGTWVGWRGEHPIARSSRIKYRERCFCSRCGKVADSARLAAISATGSFPVSDMGKDCCWPLRSCAGCCNVPVIHASPGARASA